MSRTDAPRVGFVSLGCPKALVDSERILTQLRSDGYQISPDYAGADVVVVNTCGFIDSAKAESLEAIGEALEANGRVIVTGCLGVEEAEIRALHPRVLAEHQHLGAVALGDVQAGAVVVRAAAGEGREEGQGDEALRERSASGYANAGSSPSCSRTSARVVVCRCRSTPSNAQNAASPSSTSSTSGSNATVTPSIRGGHSRRASATTTTSARLCTGFSRTGGYAWTTASPNSSYETRCWADTTGCSLPTRPG